MPDEANATRIDPAEEALVKRMIGQFAGGLFCPIELYAERPMAEHVSRYSCYRMKASEYRVQVLLKPGYVGNVRLVGCDGSRADCARWLRTMGVPVLRIGNATPKPF